MNLSIKKKEKKRKEKRFASYDAICMSYIKTSILMEQIYLSLDPMYLKSSISV